MLLIIRQPFERGDQIEVNGRVGTVEAITIRETSLAVGVGYDDDLDRAESSILVACRSVDRISSR